MQTTDLTYYIGWDVGGWNCDKNGSSRDAIVILNSALTIVGKPWRGNLRTAINTSPDTMAFVGKLFALCGSENQSATGQVTLAIDTPLGFSAAFTRLATGLTYTEPIERSNTNPYLFRQTERFLVDKGFRPLSAVKDMIGSQATKGMHVLAKFAPTVERCGVWRGGDALTAIEAYPSASKGSATIAALRDRVVNQPLDHDDKMDALTCALIAYLFATKPDELYAPLDETPASEGWIWVPRLDGISSNQEQGT